MKKGAFWLVVAALVAAGGFALYERLHRPEPLPALATVAVSLGDVVAAVEATGTLQAVTTVQVGTQVSGTIKALHADFNSRVQRGQVVAELDPSLFEAQVEQARASVLRLEADAQRANVGVEDAQQKLTRARELWQRQLIPRTDLETAEINARETAAALKGAQAQVDQARASLNQAEVNLAHTIITAPIDGIVISRNVDVGQTVAASMQAPTLFVIARDLRQMQVNASIAESDIGRIQTGQHVLFSVDAYPGERFAGSVSQVRLQPVVEQNVVSYVTVIDVPNRDLRLRPGMTANVTVETARASAVLRVPNSALRVRPSPEVLIAFGGELPAAPETEPTSGAPERRKAQDGAAARADVWILVDGRLMRVPVRAGITDGTNTAVYSSELEEGARVVTTIAAAAVPAATSSPLIPAFRGRGGGGAGRGAGTTGAGGRGTSPGT